MRSSAFEIHFMELEGLLKTIPYILLQIYLSIIGRLIENQTYDLLTEDWILQNLPYFYLLEDHNH